MTEAAPPEAGPRILVVDDSPANVRLLEAVLEAHGYAVQSADNGPAALSMIAEAPPDVVLLDVQMPGMNGHEVCRRIREDPSTAMLPVVVITAAGNEEKLSALDAGADDFVTRPFDQAELLARVRSLLRIKHYQDTISGQAAELAAWNRVLEEQVRDQVAEMERLQRLRRFLPAHVADALVGAEGEALLEPHRREVAVLHMQLRGLAAFAAEAEPETVLRAQQEFHRLVGAAAGTHTATIAFFAGDRVELFVGDPVPVEDPVGNAARAGLWLRDAVATMAAAFPEAHELSLSCGLSFGYATLGALGSEGRLDYSAIGPVVEQARLCCNTAAGAEVRCSSRAAVALAEQVEQGGGAGPIRLEPAGTVSIADHLAPSEVYRIAGNSGERVMAGAGRNEPELDIRLLGPLEIRFRGVDVPIRAARVRRLLGLLLLHRGRVVSVDRLVDEIWDNDPPESALAALRVHVSRLRKMLAGAGLGSILVTRPTGYLLDVSPASVDADRFEVAVAGARALAAAGDPHGAVRQFRLALSMWRGSALAGVASSTYVEAEAARLEEARITATEDCIAAELSAGNARGVLGELEALIVENPLREQLWALRMLALYRSGRQADALECYQALRRQLDEELGLEPSAEVNQLHQAILQQAPHLQLV